VWLCRLLLALVSFILTKCGLHVGIKELGWLRVGGFSLKLRKVCLTLSHP
jgi:hypothetical protein